MLLRVSHLTRYDYTQVVNFSPHALYLRPRESPALRLHDFRINVSPHARLLSARDPQDNALVWAHFWEPASALNIRTEFEVETLDLNPFDFLLRSDATAYPFFYDRDERFILGPSLAPPHNQTQEILRAWLRDSIPELPGETVPLVTELNSAVHRRITYARREERGIQPSGQTAQLGTGSCRDLAVLLIELCRTLGLAARFVSGYVRDERGEAANRDGSDMHAWVEIYLPGAGWKGLDPSRGVFCDDGFIPVAHASLADTVNPVQGRYYSDRPVPSRLTTSVAVEVVTP